MAATVWKGHLTFGLVSIPVRLFRAARAEKVSLHHLYREKRVEAPREIEQAPPPSRPVPEMRAAAGRVAPEPPPEQPLAQPEAMAPVSRIRQTAIDPVENTPIPRSDLVRGYEFIKLDSVEIYHAERARLLEQFRAPLPASIHS